GISELISVRISMIQRCFPYLNLDTCLVPLNQGYCFHITPIQQWQPIQYCHSSMISTTYKNSLVKTLHSAKHCIRKSVMKSMPVHSEKQVQRLIPGRSAGGILPIKSRMQNGSWRKSLINRIDLVSKR